MIKRLHSECGNSTYIMLIGLLILVVGFPLGSFVIDYMQGVQTERMETKFLNGEEEPPEDGPPEDYEPGGYTITYNL